MKVLIYGINYSPELTGIGKYSGEMGAWLAKSSIKTSVITAPPYYPNWKVADGYSALSYKKEIIDDITNGDRPRLKSKRGQTTFSSSLNWGRPRLVSLSLPRRR